MKLIIWPHLIHLYWTSKGNKLNPSVILLYLHSILINWNGKVTTLPNDAKLSKFFVGIRDNFWYYIFIALKYFKLCQHFLSLINLYREYTSSVVVINKWPQVSFFPKSRKALKA